MYVGHDHQPSDTGENEVYSFDFVNDLKTGETLTGTTSWSIAVKRGTDANPSAHLSGAPSVTGTISSQRISGLLPGVTYTLRATVVTSLGNTLSLFSHVTCADPG